MCALIRTRWLLAAIVVDDRHRRSMAEARPSARTEGSSAAIRRVGKEAELDLNWSAAGCVRRQRHDRHEFSDRSTTVAGVTCYRRQLRAHCARRTHLVQCDGWLRRPLRCRRICRRLSAVDGIRVSLTATLGRRVTVRAFARAFSYRPYYQFDFSPVCRALHSEPVRRQTPSQQSWLRSTRYDSNGRYSANRRAGSMRLRPRITARHAVRARDEGFTWQLANAGFRHNVTRNATLRLGYGYSEAQNTSKPPAPGPRHHDHRRRRATTAERSRSPDEPRWSSAPVRR